MRTAISGHIEGHPRPTTIDPNADVEFFAAQLLPTWSIATPAERVATLRALLGALFGEDVTAASKRIPESLHLPAFLAGIDVTAEIGAWVAARAESVRDVAV